MERYLKDRAWRKLQNCQALTQSLSPASSTCVTEHMSLQCALVSGYSKLAARGVRKVTGH